MQRIHSDTNFQSHCERQGNYHLAEPRGKTFSAKELACSETVIGSVVPLLLDFSRGAIRLICT
jgi:hypothetical protein